MVHSKVARKFNILQLSLDYTIKLHFQRKVLFHKVALPPDLSVQITCSYSQNLCHWGSQGPWYGRQNIFPWHSLGACWESYWCKLRRTEAEYSAFHGAFFAGVMWFSIKILLAQELSHRGQKENQEILSLTTLQGESGDPFFLKGIMTPQN